MHLDPLTIAALGAAAFSAILILWYLVRRPPLVRATKILLLFAIGIFPLTTAGTGNVAGYEATKSRRFCGSCHVMTPYADDSADLESTTLASRHARNDAFGKENCYACHADYGMFGTVTTKIGGMRHVYEYLWNFRQLSWEEAQPRIHLRKPFRNDACMRCHSTQVPSWERVGDHAGLAAELRENRISCLGGCHGPAHPFKHAEQPGMHAGDYATRTTPPPAPRGAPEAP